MKQRTKPESTGKPGFAASSDDGTLLLRFEGAWTIGQEFPRIPQLEQGFKSAPQHGTLAFETSGLTSWDSRFLILCQKLLELAAASNLAVDSSGLPQGVVRLLDLAAKVPERKGAARTAKHEPLLARVGEKTLDVWRGADSLLDFVGVTSQALFRLFTGRAVFRRTDVLEQMRLCGVEALPIVSLISILVGVILAYVGAIQLKAFGAVIYISSLVGIAMVRVLAAVMTGVIMSGRTGASFAAELGTMQVNEEIDALHTLGISPMEFLVLPRMIALVLMMPLLCLYADFMGMLGGLLVGVLMMDINPMQYLYFTVKTVALSNFWIGIFQGFVFGVLIAMAGCYRGMRCGRSASAVGQATTTAVVSCIVSIVLATSLITVLCDILGV